MVGNPSLRKGGIYSFYLPKSVKTKQQIFCKRMGLAAKVVPAADLETVLYDGCSLFLKPVYGIII